MAAVFNGLPVGPAIQPTHQAFSLGTLDHIWRVIGVCSTRAVWTYNGEIGSEMGLLWKHLGSRYSMVTGSLPDGRRVAYARVRV